MLKTKALKYFIFLEDLSISYFCLEKSLYLKITIVTCGVDRLELLALEDKSLMVKYERLRQDFDNSIFLNICYVVIRTRCY